MGIGRVLDLRQPDSPGMGEEGEERKDGLLVEKGKEKGEKKAGEGN